MNLFLLRSKAKILPSSPSMWTETEAGSLKGFLKLSIDEVLFPTEVEIGEGSIMVGTRPLPSILYSHLPTSGLSKMMLPDSMTSRLVGEYFIMTLSDSKAGRITLSGLISKLVGFEFL